MDSRRIMLGTAALKVGIATWQLQQLFERGFLPQPERVGRFRVVSEKDFPAIREAAERAGYIKLEASAAA